MKKTVSIVLIVTLLTVFFCANVSAATDYTHVYNAKSNSITSNGVTFKIEATQTEGYDETFYARYGGTGTSFDIYSISHTIITVTITNNSSKTKYLNNVYFEPIYNDSELNNATIAWWCGPRNIENYGPDINQTYTSTNGYIYLTPSANWSFGEYICVPANTSLVSICVLSFPTKLNTSDSVVGTWANAKLDAIWTAWNFTAYDTDFTPQGAHDDLLISLEALRNWLIGSSGIPEVENLLSSIISKLTWNGTYNAPSFGNDNSYDVTLYNDILFRVTAYKGIPITDVEILPPNVVVTDVMYRIPVCVLVVNYNGHDRKNNSYLKINDVFTANGTVVDAPRIYSSWIETCSCWIGNNYSILIRPTNDVISAGYNTSEVWFDVYSRTSTLTINQFTVDANLTLYNSDLSSDSDTLKNISDSVHTQEQVYFAQNQQAIQSTGLGNYHISSADGNGISAVSSDFTTIWNALSGWNSVYVFSLTLGLALTILRHAPNAISRRRRKQSND